jgi:regulator of protease activity HflC (stomatin/prohibitin superfamily)
MNIILLIIVIAVLLFLLEGFVIIRDDQVGIKIRKIFGNPMPQGQIIARKSKDVGIQADVLMPKMYWFNPITWRIKKTKMTEIPQGKIGVVEAIDGEPLPKGRLLGDHIDCNSYQDARAFLENHGKRGPQVEILRPGFYRINTELFNIASVDNTQIHHEEIGILVAQDGISLPSGYIVAPKPVDDPKKPHKFFQDGQAFIESQGYRGPQLDTLQPGEYYINPLLFAVKKQSVTEVLPGYVAVLRSNIGMDLAKESVVPKPISKKPGFDQPIHEEEEVVLTTDKNQRGIWCEPVAPGKYNLNVLAFSAYMVPTSAVTIDWASGVETRAEHMVGGQIEASAEDEKAKEFFKFSQLRVTSKDGFQLEVDVRMIIRIRPQHASFVIARFGSVANLIEQIVHPLIDSSFRNKAGEKKAVEFVMSRTDLQKEALERAKEEFEKYHVEAQNLLIAYIKVDEALLATQTNKEIAIQQQAQYEQQALAQAKRIDVKEKEARAEKQKDIIDAKLGIDISRDNAEAMRQSAYGVRDKTKSIADGDAYQNREVGKGIADAYDYQSTVIGPQILGLLKALEKIADGEVKVTPDVLVTGGADGSTGSLINTLLAMLIKEGALKITPVAQKPQAKKEQTALPSVPAEKKEPASSIQNEPVKPYEPETSEEHMKKLNDEIEKDAWERMGIYTTEQEQVPVKKESSRISSERMKSMRTRRTSI